MISPHTSLWGPLCPRLPACLRLPCSFPHSLAFPPRPAQSHLGLCNVHTYRLTSAVTSVPGNLSRTCPNRLRHTRAHVSQGTRAVSAGLTSAVQRAWHGEERSSAVLTPQALLSFRTQTTCKCFKSLPCLSLFIKGKFLNGPFTVSTHGRSDEPVMGGAGRKRHVATPSPSLRATSPHSPG